MARSARRTILPAGALLALLVGAVIVPAVLSVSVGIVALALWREAFDIVFGVLVLCFAAMALGGGIAALAFVRRSARLAEAHSDFVASVSHELRTPLAGMRLMIETLASGRAGDGERKEEVLARLLGEQRRLEALIELILQWRRRARQRTRPEQELQSLEQLVAEAVAPLAAEADPGAIQVRLRPELPLVRGPHDQLVVALRNLVHNALKFGGPGGPVAIEARHEGAQVILEVRDRGPGIPQAEQRRIFEPFFRGAGVKPGGSGLGLAVALGILEDCDGSLAVRSAPGEGACFTVCLPAAGPGAARETGGATGAG